MSNAHGPSTSRNTRTLYDPPPYTPYASQTPPHSAAATPASGPAAKPKRPPRIEIVQAEIDETMEVMRTNIATMMERGEALDVLESRTESLVVSAREFRRSAHHVRKVMWWKDMKMRLIIGLAITVVVTLTVLSIVQATKAKGLDPRQTTARSTTPTPQTPISQ